MKTARELLAELEGVAGKGDELMARLAADLGAFSEDLEGYMRATALARQASAAVIVEAACILCERERGEPLSAAMRKAVLQ